MSTLLLVGLIASFVAVSLFALNVFSKRAHTRSVIPPAVPEAPPAAPRRKEDITPVEFFRPRILAYLYAKGNDYGSFAASLLREFGTQYDPDFKEDDHRPCASEAGISCVWQTSCRLAADDLEKRGWLDLIPVVNPKHLREDMPKGYWQLTEKGKFYGKEAFEGRDPFDESLVYDPAAIPKAVETPLPPRPVFKPRTRVTETLPEKEITILPPKGICPQTGQPYHTVDAIHATALAFIKLRCAGTVPSDLTDRIEALYQPHLQAGDYAVPGKRKQTRFKQTISSLKGKLLQQNLIAETDSSEFAITRHGLAYLAEHLPQYAGELSSVS